ncbi:MAG: DMT family transporter [Asgard group archaeon]
MDRKALGLVLILTVIWGTGPVTARFLVGVSGEISPTVLALVRWILGFTLLFFVLIRNHGLKDAAYNLKADWRHFLAIGVAVAAYGLLFLFGVSLTFATNAALLTNLHPIWIAILANIFLNERISSRIVLGIAVAITGMLVVVTQGDLSLLVISPERFFGDFLVILSALAWAIQSLLARTYGIKKYGGFKTMTLSAPFAIIVLVPFALILGDIRTLVSVSLIGWLAILHFSLIISGVGYVLWYLILDRMEATQASVWLLIIPVYTIIFAFLLLSEPITISVVGGAVILLIGIYLVETALSH